MASKKLSALDKALKFEELLGFLIPNRMNFGITAPAIKDEVTQLDIQYKEEKLDIEEMIKYERLIAQIGANRNFFGYTKQEAAVVINRKLAEVKKEMGTPEKKAEPVKSAKSEETTEKT